MNPGLQFLGEFARQPLTTGALWPSSTALSKVVADCCELPPGGLVVELGAGTGAFTRLILERLNGQGRLLVVEINRTHATLLRRCFPQCEVIQGSAENIRNHLGGRRAVCIVSGLPWGNMLPQTQDRVLEAILESLAPVGQFLAFAYVHAAWFPSSRRFRGLLTRYFHRLETTPIVWRNLPPAIVFRCWKRDSAFAGSPAVNQEFGGNVYPARNFCAQGETAADV
jgi:phosphatidylethanolamine/phosphatidyl-N-methylethanolamine N-methyltransferase